MSPQKFPGSSVVVLEKSHSLGGTWAKNTYPNVSCDIPSQVRTSTHPLAPRINDVIAQLYQYSFALNAEWLKTFASQAILAYLKNVTFKHNLQESIHLYHDCLSAEWEDREGYWKVKFLDLRTSEIVWRNCRILITAVGFLDIPRGPEEIASIESFSGRVFHSANWDHTVDFTDKNVLVVGNGCSANQFVPWLIKIPTFTVWSK